MKTRWLVLSVVAGVVATLRLAGHAAQTQAEPLARPRFHHIHMNSVNPAAAIAEFLTVYPASTKVTIAGLEGVTSANNVTMLFTKVNTRPPAPGPDRTTKAAPQTAFWHHVWAAPDARAGSSDSAMPTQGSTARGSFRSTPAPKEARSIFRATRFRDS